MSLTWLIGAVVIAAACFVQGLAGFGIGLVSLAFLPFLMSPQHAIVLITLYAAVFIVIIFIPLRRDFTLHGMVELVAGTILATPVGVWLLAGLPSDLLKRLIGLVLLLIVALEWLGLYPERLRGRGWGFGAGLAGGDARRRDRHARPAGDPLRGGPGLEPAHREGQHPGLPDDQPGRHPGRLLVGGPARSGSLAPHLALRGRPRWSGSRRACCSSAGSTARASAAWCSRCSSSPAWC